MRVEVRGGGGGWGRQDKSLGLPNNSISVFSAVKYLFRTWGWEREGGGGGEERRQKQTAQNSWDNQKKERCLDSPRDDNVT